MPRRLDHSLPDNLRSLWRAGVAPAAARGPDRLIPLASFGSNPGALEGYLYVPELSRTASKAGVALVVVLHGCTQTAAGYDHGSGWSDLAERYGFAVLFPEQQRRNNPNLCFNWFKPEDMRHDEGEALSIRQMIASVSASHSIDPARVFVTGLSAGGAMALVMLATYPELFAGGAVIGGLAYGTATSVPQALERMRGQACDAGARAGDAVRAAAPRVGAWPRLTVWHGSADTTVSPKNADAIVAQWQGVQGLAGAPSRTEVDGTLTRRSWLDASGRVAIEDNRIAGMGHGVPLATSADGLGAAGPYMLDVGISSTWHTAKRWGLVDEADAPPLADPTAARETAARSARPNGAKLPDSIPSAVRAKIEAALKAGGLLR